MKNRFTFNLYWLSLLLVTFVIALGISWKVLSAVNFAYPLLHDYTGISENIEKYGPRSRVKPGFHETTREERFRLFEGIVKSIHNNGHGLEELAYHTRSGDEIKMLTRAEIIHLNDVADLYNKFKWIVLACALVWSVLCILRSVFKIQFPSGTQLLRYMLLLPLLGVFVYLFGARDIFYKLHVMLFPPGHQWFFYYEDSLMSMMMKAPEMFAYSAIMLAVLAAFFTLLIFWSCSKYKQ